MGEAKTLFKRAADRSPASGTAADLETVAKSTLGRIPKVKRPKMASEERRAEVERVAREHGADLNEDGYMKAR